MTVIVAAVTGKNRVTIAADSEVTGGWQKGNVSTPKVWADQSKGYAFGAAGSLRAAQVLRHHVDWPGYDGTDWERFLITRAVPAIREGVYGHGIAWAKKGVEHLPAWLVIAYGPLVALIEADFCVIGDLSGRLATGSGYAEALGSLGDTGPWSEADVVEAARRAALTAVGVGGPIEVVDTKRLEVRRAD